MNSLDLDELYLGKVFTTAFEEEVLWASPLCWLDDEVSRTSPKVDLISTTASFMTAFSLFFF